MREPVIAAKGVGKRYRVFDSQRARLLHGLWPRHTAGMQEVQALQDISFAVGRGESVAIIGRNGGGKSTLLEILTGTLTPTTGSVGVHGRVAALLELGSGFNPEYTGRDNVMLNGLLLGLSRADILRRFPEIEAFAEIGTAIDRRVKTYSSGMVMRLAFAVHALCEPDVLIVDEALSVGDFFFQQKCLSRLRELQQRGVSLLFVSHDMGMVRNLCTRALYLRAGHLVFDGPADRAAQLYFEENGEHGVPPSADAMREDEVPRVSAASPRTYFWTAPADTSIRTEVRILRVDFRNIRGTQSTDFRIGDRMQVVIETAHAGTALPTAVAFRNRLGQIVNITYCDATDTAPTGPGTMQFAFEITLALEAGEYGVRVYVSDPRGHRLNTGRVVCETPELGPVSVRWNYETDRAPFYGMVGLPARVSMQALDP